MARGHKVGLRIIKEELGHTDFTTEFRRSHLLVKWDGGSMLVSGSSSDVRFEKNLRAGVRRQVRLGRSDMRHETMRT